MSPWQQMINNGAIPTMVVISNPVDENTNHEDDDEELEDNFSDGEISGELKICIVWR